VQLQQRIQELDGQVEKQVQQRPQALRLLTHPGVGPVTALATEVFLGDPDRFANGKNVASYIGMIPCEHTSGKRQRLGKLTKEGNQTGGKRKSGTTRAGNPWLRRALCEGAWAASKSKGTYLQAQFRRLAALRGPKRALIAVANSILTAGYYMLHRATTYQDLGPDYFDKRNTVRATHRLVKRLEALGHRVILEPRFIADPSS